MVRDSDRYSSSSFSISDDALAQIDNLRDTIVDLKDRLQRKSDELQSYKNSKRSYLAEIEILTKRNKTLEEDKKELQSELKAADVLRDSALQAAYEYDLKLSKLHAQAEREKPFREVGKQVRIRFLERYHLLSRKKDKKSKKMEAGKEAARHGRPIPDALLCVTGDVDKDKETYESAYEGVYGVEAKDMAPRDDSGQHRGKGWAEVPDLVELVEMRGTLQSEDKLNSRFDNDFKALLKVAKKYKSAEQLRKAFGTDEELVGKRGRLKSAYRKIMEGEKKTGKSDW